jgi:hypothetical protein
VSTPPVPAAQHPAPESVTATGLGAWPGTDPVEAAKVSLGLLSAPHLPYLADLPARGVGSDAVGRTAALLLELPVDVQPYGWRFVDRPGLDHRRAVSALSTDVNVLADVAGAGDLRPAEFKVHVMGPVSLAAAIHLHYGERALRDFGARRDIAQSLAAGLVRHAQQVQMAVPGAALTLQIDEPCVAQALAGTIPTASGYRTLRAVPVPELRHTWSELATAARQAGFAKVVISLIRPAELPGGPAAGGGPAGAQAAESAAWRKALETALESGIDAVAVPLASLDTGHWELLAGAIESGVGVWAGTVPVRAGHAPPSYSVLEERIMRPWRGLGLAESSLNQLRITPETGLGALTPQEARTVLDRALEVAERLTEICYL